MVSLNNGSSTKSKDKEADQKVENDTLNKVPIISLNPPFTMEMDPVFIGIFFLSVMLYGTMLSKPNYLVLNEEHYMDLLQNVLSHRFYLDSNPPLHSILLSFISWVLGLVPGVMASSPHATAVALHYFRLLSAVSGAAVAPVTYKILQTLQVSSVVSAAGAMLVLSNHVTFTDSRFISPNPIMILASLLALYFACRGFRDNTNIWNYLMVAISLGTSMSLLHLGFTSYIFIVGFIAVKEFAKFGDCTKSERDLWKNYLIKVGTVTFVPWFLYYAAYLYAVRNGSNSGTTDQYLSPQFQASLTGNILNSYKTDQEWIFDGSRVMLLTNDPHSCYLHSHSFNYPLTDVLKSYQQVTCYDHADDGNNWFSLESVTAYQGSGKPYPIRHGDVVRIKHALTGKYLAVYPPVPCVTNELATLVSATDDLSDETGWVVEIVDTKQFPEGLWAVNLTNIRLKSNKTHHYLVQTGSRLPDWGFQQSDMGAAQSAAAVWRVSSMEHPQQDVIDALRTGVFSNLDKIREIHHTLFVTGKYDRLKKHNYDTSPYTWLKPGLAMLYSYNNEEIVQARGNTLLEGGMLLCLLLHLASFFVLLVRRARGFLDTSQELWSALCQRTRLLLLGFLFHYTSFFFLQRPLFIFQFQLAYTWLIMSCAGFLDLVLAHAAHYANYTLPVVAAYTAAVFARFLADFHFAAGYPADEDQFFVLVDW